MSIRLLLLILSLLYLQIGNTQFKNQNTFALDSTEVIKTETKKQKSTFFTRLAQKVKSPKKKKSKLTAVALAITLGPFGVHRLYLGTRKTVPVMYTLTLGGGFFILPLIDIGIILTNKDSDKIEENPYFFIWKHKKQDKKNS